MVPSAAIRALVAALVLITLADRFVQGQSQPPIPPKRVALLVGVNKYLKPGLTNLRFAERDVQEVAAELKKQGFYTKVLLGSGAGTDQATRENILRFARSMVQDLGKQDVALVMLSGHGQQIQSTDDEGKRREDAYFIPVEGSVSRPSTLVSLSEMTDEILANEVGRKLLLVDACRDVSKAAGRGAKGIQGKTISLPEDTAIFFACRAGQESFENETLRHGLFTYCLLEGLRGKAARDLEVSWSDLISHVQRRMGSNELRKYMPEDATQAPIAAGGVEHTVLAKLGRESEPGTETPPVTSDTTGTKPEITGAATGMVRLRTGTVVASNGGVTLKVVNRDGKIVWTRRVREIQSTAAEADGQRLRVTFRDGTSALFDDLGMELTGPDR